MVEIPPLPYVKLQSVYPKKANAYEHFQNKDLKVWKTTAFKTSGSQCAFETKTTVYHFFGWNPWSIWPPLTTIRWSGIFGRRRRGSRSRRGRHFASWIHGHGIYRMVWTNTSEKKSPRTQGKWSNLMSIVFQMGWSYQLKMVLKMLCIFPHPNNSKEEMMRFHCAFGCDGMCTSTWCAFHAWVMVIFLIPHCLCACFCMCFFLCVCVCFSAFPGWTGADSGWELL